MLPLVLPLAVLLRDEQRKEERLRLDESRSGSPTTRGAPHKTARRRSRPSGTQ
jgi:hypothetical protein